MKIDPLNLVAKIPFKPLRQRVTDALMEAVIPFSRHLGLRLKELTPQQVVVESPDRRRRRNHVGGAHACALALLGEYPAGLVLAQKFPTDQYRLIISSLNIEYFHQGRGTLTAIARAPANWPAAQDTEIWLDMVTEIYGPDRELIAKCQTRWQAKRWQDVRSHNSV